MPGQLAKDKVRISYIEDDEVCESLKQMALKSRTNVSALIREATHRFIEAHKGKKVVEFTMSTPDSPKK